MVNLACRGDYNVFPNQVKCRRKTPTDSQLGMISHKKSLITIFGHKHKIKNVIIKFVIFHEKISMAFGFWSIFGIKFQILMQKYLKND